MNKTKITKEKGVYEIDVQEDKIVANVIAQIVEPDDLGGYTLHGEYGVVTKDKNGITITGNIPQDMQPDVLREFNEITQEINAKVDDNDSIG